jgi:ribonuclease HI
LTPINEKEYPPPDLIAQEIQNALSKIRHIDETIYTDGSKNGQLVGSATVNQATKEIRSIKLPPECSFFTAEAVAIAAALRIAYTSQSNRFAKFSDSKAVLTALRGNVYKQATKRLIFDIKSRLHKLTIQGETVSFILIPSHCNIQGNEEVDQEAKTAAEEGEILPIPILYTDLHPFL